MTTNYKIPEGCKEVKIEQHENQLIVTFESEKREFKRGDVLINKRENGLVCVFDKIINNDCVVEIVGMTWGKITYNDFPRYFDTLSKLRHATPEEAQPLWDALKAAGKVYNPDTQEVEDLKRWRAERNASYIYLSSVLSLVITTELNYESDNNRYKAGNYFQTKEQALSAQTAVAEALNKWNNENPI